MNEEINILVVDDNQENLKVISSFLKERHYRIALASDGESALKVLDNNKIDLVLLDIMMPGMDGYEVCRIIKERDETKDIPVIFLTGRTETEDIVKGFNVGGVDYITKPFNKEELFARVNNHVQLKLIRDCLVKSELDTKKSRDYFMRTLFELARIMEQNK